MTAHHTHVSFHRARVVHPRGFAISISFSLATALFWIAVAICVVAQIAIVRSAVRIAATPRAEPRSAAMTELAWTLLPAFALVLVLLFTWRAVQTAPGRTGPGAVPAHQHDHHDA